eukprot:scaffold1.g5726.t1
MPETSHEEAWRRVLAAAKASPESEGHAQKAPSQYAALEERSARATALAAGCRVPQPASPGIAFMVTLLKHTPATATAAVKAAYVKQVSNLVAGGKVYVTYVVDEDRGVAFSTTVESNPEKVNLGPLGLGHLEWLTIPFLSKDGKNPGPAPGRRQAALFALMFEGRTLANFGQAQRKAVLDRLKKLAPGIPPAQQQALLRRIAVSAGEGARAPPPRP